MNYIEELYPIPPEVEKLSVFTGDGNVTGDLKTGNNEDGSEWKWFFKFDQSKIKEARSYST